MVLKVLGGILVVWVGFMVLGAVIKGLFWLVIVGAVLFAGTAAYGYIKNKSRKQIH
ncbi:hypothetical protein [Sciscionella sediminilitoris]|uniref:hypothetical protein n=1 Tax=Sciscionella sediminilitoris TaxID=1445613 RepID=UPI0004DF557F|nr:hypothetical protein [Sciscionella sp. SE31]